MSKDLWEAINPDKIFEENRAIDILREQAQLLEKKTDHIVKASFAQVNHKPGAFVKAAQSMITITNAAMNGVDEQNQDDLEGKEDFNKNYQKTKYRFEIYNNNYRFRLFYLYNSVEFPIEIEADEDICDETGLETREIISSNARLEAVINRIFGAQKTQLVVSRMIQSVNKDIDSLIKESLKERPKTVKELAEELKVTNKTIQARLEKLANDELVYETGGKKSVWSLM